MMNKGVIEIPDKDCSADGALAAGTETKHSSPLEIISCMAVELPADVLKMDPLEVAGIYSTNA